MIMSHKFYVVTISGGYICSIRNICVLIYDDKDISFGVRSGKATRISRSSIFHLGSLYFSTDGL